MLQNRLLIAWMAMFLLISTSFYASCQELLPIKNTPFKEYRFKSNLLQSQTARNTSYQYNTFRKNSVKLTFTIPQVRVYNAADFYVDGKFSCLPFSSWGPYQTPFYLNQPIVVTVKER
jgi:hypothetical protein